MHYVRKPAIIIASIMLPLLLFGLGFLLSFSYVFGTPDRLKRALQEANVYEAAVATLVRQPDADSSAPAGEQATDGVPAGQDAMRKAIEEAVPPDVLESQSAKVLDGVYAWLQGRTPEPSFQIDVGEIKETLTSSLSEQARERATQLPPCGPDTPALAEDFDPFGATCLPPGTDPNVVADKTRQEVANSELFKDPVLTAEDIRTSDGTSLQEQLKPLSNAYDAVRQITLISAILAVGAASAILLLSSPRRAGVRRLGIIFLSVGLASAGIALLGGLVISGIVSAVTRAAGDAAVQTAAAKALQFLSNDIRTWWIWYGVALAAAGACMLASLAIFRRQQGTQPQAASPVASRAGRLTKR